MKTWEFSCTMLEKLGHVSSILGAFNLGAQIKDLRTYVWSKNLTFLEIMRNGCNSPDITL